MAADSFVLELSTTIENVDVNVALISAESTVIEYSFPQGPVGPPGPQGVNTWGSLSGTLSAQTDLWAYLSAGTFSPSQLTAFLDTNAISLCSIDVKGQILSAGSDLFDIFFTTVQANSASWEESAEILPTVTNYLSTSNVQILSLSTASLVVSGVGIPFILKNSGGSNSVYFDPASNGNAGSFFANYIYSSNIGGRGDDNLTISYGGGGTRSIFLRSGGTTRATLLSNGNFGLGLIAPTPNEKLTVSGNISATGTVFASAANISGDIVANRIQATVKNFYIDHPTKLGKHLVYSSLEAPYNGIQLTGEGELKNGKCVVELPDYISNLIHKDSTHIQLTNYKHSKSLYVDSIEIHQNRFTVKCDAWTSKFSTLKFFWLLNGVRKDIPKLETEV